MISIRNLLICLAYGMLSTCQTLNSRYLFRSIGFDYYSFVQFMINNKIYTNIVILHPTYRKYNFLLINFQNPHP